MKFPRRLAILLPIGLIAYAVLLVAYMPAAVAWSLVPDAVSVRLYGLTGSVWNARAETVTVAGARFAAVHWKLSPLALLTGTVAIRVRAQLPHGGIDARVRLGQGDSLVAEGVRVETTVDTLLQWARAPTVAIMAGGQVEALLRHLRIEGGRPTSAQGGIIWRDATLTLGGGIALGNVVLRLQEAAEAGIRITVTNDGGLLRVAGHGGLAPDGSYSVTLQVRARAPGAPASRRAAHALGLTDLKGTTVEVSGVVGGPVPTLTVR